MVAAAAAKPSTPAGRRRDLTAKEKALALLDKRDYSRAELLRKLAEKDFDEAEATEAVDRLVELGFVDDARYAPIIVRHYAAKGYGPQRVRQELQKRGIPKELWDEALAEMPEQDDTLDRLIRSKLGGKEPSKENLSRVSAALQRRGYGWQEIREAIERLNIEE